MKPAILRYALVAAFALAAGAALLAVRANERLLAQGRVVLAELAPVDPRSLMQGDYMALRYAIDNDLARTDDNASPLPRYAYLRVDGKGRATLAGSGDTLPADPTLVAMRIRRRDGRGSIGPNAFFFQEGRAEAFAGARWGEFRVGDDGTALLTHLRNAELKRLGENKR